MHTYRRFEIAHAANGPNTMPWHLSLSDQGERVAWHTSGRRPAGPVDAQGVRVVVRRQPGTAWPSVCVVAFYERQMDAYAARDRAMEAAMAELPTTKPEDLAVFTCPADMKPNHARLYNLGLSMTLVSYRVMRQALMPYGGFNEDRHVPLVVRGQEVLTVPMGMGWDSGELVMAPRHAVYHVPTLYAKPDSNGWVFRTTTRAVMEPTRYPLFEQGASECLDHLMLTEGGKAMLAEARVTRPNLGNEYADAMRWAVGK